MPALRVLMVVSECVPLCKTGGLGDVAGALPAALRARGVDVRVVMPRYRITKRYPAVARPEPLDVWLGPTRYRSAVYDAVLPGNVPIHLLEHDVLFDRDGLYRDRHGDFGDNLTRYAFLAEGAFALSRALGWMPHVWHGHDWQSGLVPMLLPARGVDGVSVLTIHNLGYQGQFAASALEGLQLAGLDVGRFAFAGDVNLLASGLRTAHMLSTVSPRYAWEIQTDAGGMGLAPLLRERSDDLVGILNGIDDGVWNPATDPHLPAGYDVNDLSGKAACKRALQEALGLPVRADVPLVGMVSRLAHQKGIDVFVDALKRILRHDLQFVVLGSGESWAESYFEHLSHTTAHFRARFGMNEQLAHRIEAAADVFVMPSRYEPCGLNQLYSQRYGTLPVVRRVGGLDDTVEHRVDGFKFDALDGETLAGAILEAAHVFRHDPSGWRRMQRSAMSKSMGWDGAAGRYEALYRLALRRRSAIRP